MFGETAFSGSDSMMRPTHYVSPHWVNAYVRRDGKADEAAPYAPHRIQSLLAYAVSERGMRAAEEEKGC